MKRLLGLIVLITSNTLLAQGFLPPKRDNKSLWQDFTYDIGNVFLGVKHAYTRPFHWSSKDALRAGGVATSTLGFYLLDEDINRAFVRNKQEVPPALLDYGWYAGQPQNNYAITGAVYLTGLFTKNEKLRRTGVLLISSATATGFLQQMMKSSVGRARPSTEKGKNHFKLFDPRPAYGSFPSGHGILSFTTAHILAKQFKSPWVKAGFYTIGAIPGVSRVFANAHWASDVFFSWSMSFFIVEAIDFYLDRKYDEKYNDSNIKKTEIDLSFNGNGIGVSFTF